MTPLQTNNFLIWLFIPAFYLYHPNMEALGAKISIGLLVFVHLFLFCDWLAPVKKRFPFVVLVLSYLGVWMKYTFLLGFFLFFARFLSALYDGKVWTETWIDLIYQPIFVICSISLLLCCLFIVFYKQKKAKETNTSVVLIGYKCLTPLERLTSVFIGFLLVLFIYFLYG